MRRVLILGAVLGLMGSVAYGRADTWSASLLPSQAISGPAGSAVGWGYSITNQSSTQWLVLENVTENPLAYTASLDSVFDYPILAPGQSASEAYSPGISGLLGFVWSSTAPLYYVNSGSFVLAADWYSGDPFAGGTDLGAAQAQALSYTAQVSPSAASPVPEPGTVWLVFSCVLIYSSYVLAQRYRTS